MTLFEIITALGATGTAVAAWEALKTWKKQLRGSKAHEIAWKYLEAIFHLRDAINYGVRNPFISVSEFQQASEAYYGKDNVEKERLKNPKADHIAVYAMRWKEVDDARRELRAAKVQAEVWWGQEIVSLDKPMGDLIGMLYTQVRLTINSERGAVDDSVLYYLPGENTEFNLKLDQVVKEIDSRMRPHIRYEYESE